MVPRYSRTTFCKPLPIMHLEYTLFPNDTNSAVACRAIRSRWTPEGHVANPCQNGSYNESRFRRTRIAHGDSARFCQSSMSRHAFASGSSNIARRMSDVSSDAGSLVTDQVCWKSNLVGDQARHAQFKADDRRPSQTIRRNRARKPWASAHRLIPATAHQPDGASVRFSFRSHPWRRLQRLRSPAESDTMLWNTNLLC